ncbi:hypothetical protein SAMN05920897_12214 [Alkalispirochaeta americana]|uniref:Uncharacterized protein n=1 Tax=Alkalispirochaeta americana TaxID=159291 RepID=A0A1N6XBS2_9SPIO|nr:hypothetical protein [Alkalispirochaeta americana]SIQ99808.1 hypothetical protein SAMN05920897_12214 [Alkalispirochaeta americana]
MKQPRNKWKFRQRFRANAYGWSASTLATQRLKEALSEIKAVKRKDPVAAAEGAIILMERIWPAFAHIDTSSGALGNAAAKAVQELTGIIVAAPVDEDEREQWLQRLQQAIANDGVDYLGEVRDRWGELCGSAERASREADSLLPAVRNVWSQSQGGYFSGTPSCLSCLLVSGRYQELLDLIDEAPFVWWHYRQFGVRALEAMEKIDEAIEYAEQSRSLNDPSVVIARTCEGILLRAGRADEAYLRYAHDAHQAGTYLATCRSIIRTYPNKEPREILQDCIDRTPFEPGKWFAAAKTLGFLDIAAGVASRSPVNITTLLRAARDFSEPNPSFSRASAMAALHWMSQGQYYEITDRDIRQARDLALSAARAEGSQSTLEETSQFITQLAESDGTDEFVRRILQMQR